MKKVRVLSIEGGGILGLSSAMMLIELENRITEKLGKKILLSDFFDFWAGNSSGSIVCALHLLQNKEHTSSEVKNIFLNIMHQKLSFMEAFGTTQLKDLKCPCLFPAYEPEKDWLNFFTQHYALLDSSYNFYLKDAIAASCAIPVFFPPVTIRSLSSGHVTESTFCAVFGLQQEDIKELLLFLEKIKLIDGNGNIIKNVSQKEIFLMLDLPPKYLEYKFQISRIIDRVKNNQFKFIDGCVFANNPVLCAVIEASKLQFEKREMSYPKFSDMLLVSMGVRLRAETSYVIDPMNPEFRNQLTNILFKTPQELAHFQLQFLFDSLATDKSYFSLYPQSYKKINIFDVSDKNVCELIEVTNQFIQENDFVFQQIVDYILS